MCYFLFSSCLHAGLNPIPEENFSGSSSFHPAFSDPSENHIFHPVFNGSPLCVLFNLLHGVQTGRGALDRIVLPPNPRHPCHPPVCSIRSCCHLFSFLVILQNRSTEPGRTGSPARTPAPGCRHTGSALYAASVSSAGAWQMHGRIYP